MGDTLPTNQKTSVLKGTLGTDSSNLTNCRQTEAQRTQVPCLRSHSSRPSGAAQSSGLPSSNSVYLHDITAKKYGYPSGNVCLDNLQALSPFPFYMTIAKLSTCHHHPGYMCGVCVDFPGETEDKSSRWSRCIVSRGMEGGGGGYSEPRLRFAKWPLHKLDK